MDNHQKVLWSEGMFLTPHHFQQQDRFLQTMVWSHGRALNHLHYGLNSLQVDEDALAVGDFLLSKTSGILPDGTVFRMPEEDALPPSRSLASLFDEKGAVFDAERDAQPIYLGIPMQAPGAVAFSEQGVVEGVPTRYRQARIQARDDGAVDNEQEVLVARKNIRILIGNESQENYTTIKVAEVQRDSSGKIVLNKEYIPPCLSVSGSPRLELAIRHILEVLTDRSKELAAQRRDRGGGLVDYAMSESANFGLLQIINAFIPGLRHFYHQTGVHPEQVYLELARLAGALCTMSSEGEPDQLPLYIHDDLTTTFRELEMQLQQLINVVIPTRSLRLPQKESDDGFYEVRLPEDATRDLETQWYVGVAADVSPDKLIADLPLKIKIASGESIKFFITSALRGLGIEYLPTPPQELPINPDWKYFKLLNAGANWDEVVETGTLGVFIPDEFKNLRLECYAVKGD